MSEQHDTIPGIAGRSEHSDTSPLGMSDDDEFSRTMVLDTAAVGDPEPDAVLQPGSVLRDRYLIRERVAGGSMGVVYKAIDRHLDDAHGGEADVAIKVLSPQLAGNADALRALQQEAAKGRYLSHPNIVRFVDLDREGRLYFIVMEWLEGQSLADALDSGSLQPDEARSLDIVRQVAEALAHAHRCGVVHADVKPGNVMLLPDGTVKLVDFGIARIRQQGDRHGNAPAALKAATPAYSSMQVLTGEEPAPADDVFSLACLAYRLLAGHRVFGPRNAAEAAEAGMEPQPPQGLDAERWKALKKGLSFSRVARQKSPLELVQGLQGTRQAAPTVGAREEPRVMPEAEAAPAPAPGSSPAVDESLRISHEDIFERRFETRARHWPWVLLATLGAAVAALVWRPDWRNTGIEFLQQQLERLQHETALAESAVVSGGSSGDAGVLARDSAPTAGPATATSKGPAAPVAAAAAEVATKELAPQEDVATVAVEPLADAIDASNDPGADGVPTPADTVAAEAPEAAEPEPMTVPSQADEIAAEDTAALIANASEPVRGNSASIVLAAPGEEPPMLALELFEDGDAISVELFRWFGLGEPLLVRVDEVGFSGSRSPGDDGQYALSGGGVVNFDAGQRTATLTIGAQPDTLREPDMQADLLLRDYYSASTVLARIDLRLLDDDQRAYEAELPDNTVAFAAARIFVRERDPAAQIDVVRYNPDQSSLSVSYSVVGDTATEGEDFFAPSRRFVTFGPGQRNARILVPLVQDNLVEGDESFALELNDTNPDSTTIRRITVMIRDDDTVAQ